MAAPDPLDHLIHDLQTQREQLQQQIETFISRERTTTALLDKLQELRDRADDTATIKLGRLVPKR